MAQNEQPDPPPKKKRLPTASAPWLPVPYELADATALQALQEGRADPVQQRRALEWIIRQCAGTYDLAFRPGGMEGSRDTDFALGRQFVGQQIVKLLHLAVGALRHARHADPPEPLT